MSLSKTRFLKVVSVYLIINILAQIFFPTIAFALTSGPKQPEFSSFEPVNTTNMVNDFTGDFTYNLPVVNIPGPNGSGYALSLSYHSGTSPEEEASWVGYGWTLNPGAINRGKQGFPDDFKGDDILYKNRVPKNWTVSVGLRGGLEIVSIDNLGISASAAVKYNSYKGFGTNYSIGASVHSGLASLNYSVSGEDGHSFRADINPAALFKKKQDKAVKKAKAEYSAAKDAEGDNIRLAQATHDAQLKLEKETKKSKQISTVSKVVGSLAGSYGMHMLADEFRASSVQDYSSTSINVSLNLGGDPAPVHIGVEGGIFGNYTEQVAKTDNNKKAFGYMYQAEALAYNSQDQRRERMMDYHVEKESMYNKRDRYLSIPFQSADMFNVTGEGQGGAFKLYSNDVGHFYPNEANSHTIIGNLGFDFTLGLDIQPFTGFNVGIGWHDLTVQNWNNLGNSGDYAFGNTADEHHFFRFNGDLGGNVLYADSDEPYRAGITNITNVPGAKAFQPQFDPNAIKTELTERSGRSSYIDYNTNKEMLEKVFSSSLNKDIYYRSHTKNTSATDETFDFVDRTSGNIGDKIGEIATVNQDGNKYVYGLPVFSADEKNMSYSVKDQGSVPVTPLNNFLIYKDVSGGITNSEVGEIRNSPYATSYLLTEITTPEYIDRTFDGPSNDDFGGWTKFNYRQGISDSYQTQYGGSDKSSRSFWYKWRFPYNGLNYDRGELCDPRDDMGGMSSGVKEIYYLKSIETKTHIAYFITNRTNVSVSHADGNITLQGSNVDRKDGLGAAADDDADENPNAKGAQQLEKLEKIVVYAKNANNQLVGKPIKTVRLEHSYELCKNLPNSANYSATGPVDANSGKLTLKKVWFEYEGIVNAKIAPYEFKYQNKLQSEFQSEVQPGISTDLLAKYNNDVDASKDIIGYGNGLDENPNYARVGLDVWGNHGYDIANRSGLMRSWLYQGKYPSGTTFDPAAWQLKTIKLPSGGEILVQYEQHEYAYVQDEMAMGMMSLVDNVGGPGIKNEVNSDNKYYINLNDFDLDSNNNGTVEGSEIDAFVTKCSTYVSKKKVYFKFLYKLIGETAPSINGCGSEYITGYSNVTVNTEGSGASKKVYLSFNNPNKYTVPRKVCRDYVTRNVSGLNLDDNCNVARDAMSEGDPTEMVKGLKNRLGTDFNASDNNCKKISLESSYFRLPLLKAKRGGGVRVKRILMFDSGLEPGTTGDAVLYGSEYIYKNLDGSSSGVATNEPGGIREENALISFLDKRAGQDWAMRVVSGNDKEQFEGPIGESLLPPPSIGYERVVVKNIHSGKSGNGYKVSEFNTYKDPRFAFSNAVKMTEIDDHAKDWLYVPAIWVNLEVDNRWVSQGYSFIMNSMHGQIKRMAVYGGSYTDGAEDANFKSYEEVYDYYNPGDKVPVLNENGTITNEYLGKEMEVSMEMKSVDDVMNDAGLQIDFSTGIALFIPIFSFSLFPSYSYNEKKLRTHTISKVVRYPSIQKSVTTTRDGIVHVSENKLFNKATGTPIATVTYDGYDKLSVEQSTNHKGSYTNYTIPAYLVYNSLGQKSKNAGYSSTQSATVSAVSGEPGNFTFTLPNTTLIDQGKLVKGDLLKLSNSSSTALYYIRDFSGSTVKVQVLSATASISNFTGLEVINSGYRNSLSLSAGKITTYGADYTSGAMPPSPLTVSGGTIVQSNLTGVLAASAETYSDDWNNSYVTTDYNLGSITNEFETSKKGKWRNQANYAYRTDIKDAITGTNRAYNGAGVFTDFTGFNYTTVGSNSSDKWLRTNNVTIYSPDGNALEEENILGIKSTSKFGHNESVPVLIAKNASYSSVLFKSFEDITTGVNTTYAHSGRNSWEINGSSTYNPGSIYMNDQIRNYGLSSKFWIRTQDSFDPDFMESYLLIGTSDKRAGDVKKLSRVGEWTLVEVVLKDVYTGIVNGTEMKMMLGNNTVSSVWVDDIRVSPLDASMVCYVYDKNNLRLLASFDDQHFGLYYQYNAEGQLVRKLVETERGTKTITETQYNTPVR